MHKKQWFRVLTMIYILIIIFITTNGLFSQNIRVVNLRKVTSDQLISSVVYKDNKLYYFNNEGLCEYDLQSNTRNIVFIYDNIKTAEGYLKAEIIIKDGDKIGKIALSNDKSTIGFKAIYHESYQYAEKIHEEERENDLFYNFNDKKIQSTPAPYNIDGWSFKDEKIIYHMKYNGYNNDIIGFSYWGFLLNDSRQIAEDKDSKINVAVQNNGNIIAYSSAGKLCTENINFGISKKFNISIENYLIWSPDNKYLFQMNSRGIQYCDLVKQQLTESTVFDENIFKDLNFSDPVWTESNKIYTTSNNDIYELTLNIIQDNKTDILESTKVKKESKKKIAPIRVERKAPDKKDPDKVEIKINDYTVIRKIRGPAATIDITKNGIEVYRNLKSEGNWFIDGDCIELVGEEGCVPKAGECLTGDGIPNFVIGWWTGGAYCCSKYLILSLGDEVSILNYIYNGCSALLFKDIDNDGIIELIGRDWGYQGAYWSGDKALIAPVVIWKFMDGKYDISTKLMKKPAPTEKEMKEYSIEHKEESQFTACLIHYLLDLVYTGNGDKTDKFYDIFSKINAGVIEYYGENPVENKTKFMENFNFNLKKSEYWEYIKVLNRWK